MFRLFCRTPAPSEVEQLTSILVDEPVRSPEKYSAAAKPQTDWVRWSGRCRRPPGPLPDVGGPRHRRLRTCSPGRRGRGDLEGEPPIRRCDSFLAWALKDEYWGVAHRQSRSCRRSVMRRWCQTLCGSRSTDSRMGRFTSSVPSTTPRRRHQIPFSATIAEALGRCALGRWEGRSCVSEARATLTKLAASGDDRVRVAAMEALAGLAERA